MKATRLICLLCLFAFVPLPLARISPALAAGFAEDHTILYYLIEMQRRATRTCGGAAMPEAPSLMPSESLRRIAALSASSGKPTDQVAAEAGLSGLAHLVATAQGSSPRHVFNTLVSGQCSAIMNPEFRYIGASAQGGQWTLIMAASEPGLSPLPPPDASPGTAPDKTPGTAAPPVSRPIAVGLAPPPDLTVRLGGHNINPNSEFEPAKPIVVRELPSPALPPTPTPVPHAARAEPRPGVTPLADTRPPEAISDNAVTVLIPQPPTQPDSAPALAPAQLSVQPPAQPNVLSPAPTAPLALPSPIAAAPARTPPPASQPTIQTGPQETRMLDLINAVRASARVCGGTPMPAAPPLRGNALLDASAHKHTKDLGARRYFSSTTPDGKNLGQRVTDGGYAWSLVAENLLAGRSVPGDALEKWLGNENQCRNLMDREFKDIGIGFDPAGPYWSIILAAPSGGGLPTQ